MKRMKVKIGDVCTLKSGTSLKDNVLNDTDGIPYIKVSDMNLVGNEKYIITANSYADESIDTKMLFPKGTILFPKRGGAIGTNKKRIANRVVCADLNTMGVIPSEIIRPLFLYYYFQNIDFGTLYNGSSVPQINNTDIAPMEIELLSLDEQDEAIEVLEKIDSIIRKRKTELKKLDELIKARFVEMFGHQSHNEKQLPYLTIDDVAEIYLGITHTPTYVESGVMFISAKNTSGDFLDLSDVKYISREEFESSPKGSKPQVNDVLFSRVGSNLGHPVILEEDLELCTFVSLGFLRTKGNVTSNYLKHWMRDDFFAKQVSEHVKGGGQPNLNTGWLKEFKIIVPDIECQREFDAFCKQVDKSKFVIQKALEEAQVLFDSLMQKYFG